MSNLAFIGLGVMGFPMAGHLAKVAQASKANTNKSALIILYQG